MRRDFGRGMRERLGAGEAGAALDLRVLQQDVGVGHACDVVGDDARQAFGGDSSR